MLMVDYVPHFFFFLTPSTLTFPSTPLTFLFLLYMQVSKVYLFICKNYLAKICSLSGAAGWYCIKQTTNGKLKKGHLSFHITHNVLYFFDRTLHSKTLPKVYIYRIYREIGVYKYIFIYIVVYLFNPDYAGIQICIWYYLDVSFFSVCVYVYYYYYYFYFVVVVLNIT